jgi:TonB family protein
VRLRQQLLQAFLIQALVGVYMLAAMFLLSLIAMAGLFTSLFQVVLVNVPFYLYCALALVATGYVAWCGRLELPLLRDAAKSLVRWGGRAPDSLNIIWPGSGNVFQGQNLAGWTLMVAYLATLASLTWVFVALFFPQVGEIALSVLGFLPRTDLDQATLWPLALALLASLLVCQWLARYALQDRQATMAASMGTSYLLHWGVICSLLLIPISIHSGEMRQQIDHRAQELNEQLRRARQRRQEAQRENASKDQRARDLDIQLAPTIEGLNEFQSSPVGSKAPASVSYGETDLDSDTIQGHRRGRQHQSYSEHLSGKLREGGRDQVLWQSLETSYAVVVEYTIEPSGRISRIEVVDPSHDVEADSLAVSVVESMDPVPKTPEGQRLKVTELFWNTRPGDSRLDSELKRELSHHPDGRVIRVI